MQSIIVTFPTNIQPEKFIKLMQDGVNNHSKNTIEVEHLGLVNGENDYLLKSEDTQAFYAAGIMAAVLMNTIENKK